jgi:formate hydrogenlyase subunit 6/NADH:ubiquinone oxidoreductase subunit I
MCPVDAITGVKKELHVISDEFCIECGVCGRICPKEAVLNASDKRQKKIKRNQWPKPVIGDGCVGCNICIDICPYGCIGQQAPRPEADKHPTAILKEPKKCVACTMCRDACPIEVIEMR